MKTTQATASASIKLIGGSARVHWITISNNGTAGTAGEVELRDNMPAEADTGTLRWSVRFASGDETAVHYNFDGGQNPGIDFANGIRLVLDAVTNVIITVGWEG